MMRFESIVVGVDFSPESRAAVRWLAESFAPAARLVLVHACPEPSSARVPGRRFISTQALADVACGGAREQLTELVSELGVRAETRAVIGAPAEVLVQAARDFDADLLVIGPHSPQRGFAGLLGSTGEALMLSCELPVLLVGSPPEGPPQRILAPVDASPLSREILSEAYDLSSWFGARLIALHVHDTAAYAALSVMHGGDTDAIRRDALEESQFWFQQYLDLARVPREKADLVVSFGEARHEILAMAQQEHAQLIVLGSHGGGGAIFRRVLGSVAAWVLRNSRGSVLVLHGAQRGARTRLVETAAR
jgi:nucleotide-binding universal stress UspA family protein